MTRAERKARIDAAYRNLAEAIVRLVWPEVARNSAAAVRRDRQRRARTRRIAA